MTNEQTKAIATLLEQNGIKATKEQVLTACIRALIGAGISPDQALDTVCGQGVFKRLAADVYGELRR